MPLSDSPGRRFAKYFAHGLAFGLLFLVVGVAWAFRVAVLVVCGLYLGLAIGIVLFFVFVGYVNVMVTEALWFPVRTGFLTCLGHGLLLCLALVPVNAIVLGVQAYVTPDLMASLGLYAAMAPITGLLAKAIAGIWRFIPSERDGNLEAAPLIDVTRPPPRPYDFGRK